MNWLLIVWMITHNGYYVATTQRFENEVLCERASEAVVAGFGKPLLGAYHKVSCINLYKYQDQTSK